MFKRVKKALVPMILGASLLAPTHVFAEQPVKIFLDGQQLSFVADPFIENGTTMVPFRPVFEKLGLKITWNPDSSMVVGEKSGLVIKLFIGLKTALVNDKFPKLEIAPKIINGNTFVPLRFVAEATGKQVSWDGVTNSITIGERPQAGSSTDSIHPAAGANINNTAPTVFRNTYWGMTMSQVKEAEKEASLIGSTRDLIFYEGVSLSNINMTVAYKFSNDKLVSGTYSQSNKHTVNNDYITDYNSLKKELTTQYGTPATDSIFGSDPVFKNGSASNDDVAAASEPLDYFASWDIGGSDGTEIFLLLDGKDYEHGVYVMFKSKKYAKDSRKK
ncbi:copper amine oxidase N-terminal domain-containing protein [Paenibacillus sp. P26]|nr:copper amine oxidase N-terminal domain-containing protein [Paenibacillus sp. P26]UUZ92231.1 copper amine oxidase N-terminal domain-containing protein [Paenibacillus sp. P25]